MTSSGIDTTYNGWANYHTWNISLFVQNEEPLYRIGCRSRNYRHFLDLTGLEGSVTPDGVSWTDPDLDTDELDEMIGEL